MEKEKLIEELEKLLEDINELEGKIEDIPDTPINKISDLINGETKNFYSYKMPEEGLIDRTENISSRLENLIIDLKGE